MVKLTPADQEALTDYKKLWVGFSGGLDSTVLLHVLAQLPVLKEKIHAIHVNHNIHSKANEWEEHCGQICASWGIPLTVCSIQINASKNIEEQARILRYQKFESFIQSGDALILGHHHDDQAETILLQLFRGTGIDGLAGMSNLRVLAKGKLIRPFLQISRDALLNYAKTKQLIWIEDSSNQQVNYSRNFIRHEILPLIEKRWPKVKHSINRVAQHAATAREHLTILAQHDAEDNLNLPCLLLDKIIKLSYEKLTNILRIWLKNQNARMLSSSQMDILIREVIFAAHDKTPHIKTSEYIIRRYRNKLYFLGVQNQMLGQDPTYDSWPNFPKPIHINSNVLIEARPADKGFYCEANQSITIRYRQGGETIIFRKQRKNLKKILQELRIPPWERDQIPLLYVGDELAAVIGYIISDSFYTETNRPCFELRVLCHNH